MKKKQLILGMIVFIFLTMSGASCTDRFKKDDSSKGEDSPKDQTDADKNNDDQSHSISLPADYPSDGPTVYPGANITRVNLSEGTNGTKFEVDLKTNNLDVDTMRNYYDDEADKNGWERLTRDEDLPDKSESFYYMVYVKKGQTILNRSISITILRGSEFGEEFTIIQMTVDKDK